MRLHLRVAVCIEQARRVGGHDVWNAVLVPENLGALRGGRCRPHGGRRRGYRRLSLSGGTLIDAKQEGYGKLDKRSHEEFSEPAMADCNPNGKSVRFVRG